MGRVGVRFQHQVLQQARGQYAEGSGRAQLVAGDGHYDGLASTRDAALEFRLVVIERRHARVRIGAAGAQEAQVRMHALDRAQRLRSQAGAGTPVDPAASHDQFDFRAFHQGHGDGRGVGDDGERQGRQGAGDGQVGRTRVEKQHLARAHEGDGGLGQAFLALGRFLLALRQAAAIGRQRQCAAVHALAQAGRRHLAQVAAYRIFGNVELARQLQRQHPAIGVQLLLDQRVALFEEQGGGHGEFVNVQECA